jgi:23S rRNA (guanosine2251-2'-O)-methyltransferase
MQELVLVLHNIRSVHNAGSILRTAECAGIRRVLLCGHTPTPIDRFGRKRADLGKVALGAEDAVVWSHVDTTEEAIRALQKEGAHVVALEQDANSIPYTSFTHDGVVALVLGEEVHGIPKEILSLCDSIIEIPMHGKKESLNVSVATGVVVFRFIEKSL